MNLRSNQQTPSSSSTSHDDDSDSSFDRLPDDLLLTIFHKIQDARSLFRCLCVSKRFSTLIPLVRSLHLSLPRRKPITKPTSLFSCFTLFLTKFISRVKRLAIKPPSSTESLKRVLKKFDRINSIHINLPFYYTNHEDVGFDCLVKWKAEFGRDLKNCVIMGADSLKRVDEDESEGGEDNNGLELLSDIELRFRVVWIISTLISASSRHHLLRQILSDHPCLERITVSDGNNQGKLCMNGEQVREMRDGLSNSLNERTPVPELSIKMSHVRCLELLECGVKLMGATLVEVKALNNGDGNGNGGGDFLGGFDGDEKEKMVFDEAVKEMLKVKKSYVMTMNAF